jgi:hypothetical protein
VGPVTARPEAPSGWEVSITEDAGFRVTHRGERVVSCKYVFWGAAYHWAASEWGLGTRGPEGTSFWGIVPRLRLRVTGMITRPAPGTLRYHYEIEAGQALNDIVGGGLEFSLKPRPNSFQPRGEPFLQDGKTGWGWNVGDGQSLSVAFQTPPAELFFEKNHQERLRALFVGSRVEPGKYNFTMTVTLPPGGRVVPSAAERYGPAVTRDWARNALAGEVAPVDLSFLNHKPAGKHGFVQVQGGRLVFEDGTPARFWGTNVAAQALFAEPAEIRRQAQRIARLGYNLVRLHHHDTTGWVSPTVINKYAPTSQQMNVAGLDKIDWWVKCLKDEGVYVWLDLHVGRQFKLGDQVGEGFDELRRRGGEAKGFCYFNARVQELMKKFQHDYLTHTNRYTGLAYKDDPVVMGVLVTNENDLTHHFGHLMLADKSNPWHRAVFLKEIEGFSQATGLAPDQVERTWVPGPSKMFLNDCEHRFNTAMLGDLRALGLRVPAATTSYWAFEGLYSLPALTDGDVIDVHSYGEDEALNANPRYEANFIDWIGAARVHGKPLTVSEWNVPYPIMDRFTAPLYVAGIGALQGWDAPMLYNYSQGPLGPAAGPDKWSTLADPALTGLIPAAAVLFRQQHVRPAQHAYCLDLTPRQLYETTLDPGRSAAIRTLLEQSRLTVGLPRAKELHWVPHPPLAPDVTVVTDPHKDFIPAGQTVVCSDTGEIRRDWGKGIQTINTPKSQAASGWIGGEEVVLGDVTLRITTPKAVVAVTALDDKDISRSRRILVSVCARVLASSGGRYPLLSEPVSGTLTLHSSIPNLALAPLYADGTPWPALKLVRGEGVYTITLPAGRGTHWYVLEPEDSGR